MSIPENKEIKSRFATLLDAGTNRMLSGLTAYHIWKWMSLAINLNSPGGKELVDRNLAIMNRHNIFFSQILRSNYKTFVADLWIFFDKDGYNEAFSLKKLVEATSDKLTAVEIAELNKEIEKIKKEHGKNIAFLQELRNADVAHQETDSRVRHLLYANIEGLFAAVQQILNLISNKYDRSVHWWKHVPEEVDRQMKWIMENLERGETIRLKEIEEKWGIKPSA